MRWHCGTLAHTHMPFKLGMTCWLLTLVDIYFLCETHTHTHILLICQMKDVDKKEELQPLFAWNAWMRKQTSHLILRSKSQGFFKTNMNSLANNQLNCRVCISLDMHTARTYRITFTLLKMYSLCTHEHMGRVRWFSNFSFYGFKLWHQI